MKRYVIRRNSIAGYMVRLGPRLFWALLFLLISFQILSFALEYVFAQPMIAEWGTIEHGQWMNTYVFREEEVIWLPISGDVHLLVENGARIRQGEPLAEIIHPALSSQVDEEGHKILHAIDRRLYTIEEEIKELDKDIDFYNRHLSKLQPGSAREGMKLTLNQIELRRRNLLSAKEEVLKEGKMKIAPHWQDHYRVVRAEAPGVFLTGLDGGESIGFEALQEDEKLFSGRFQDLGKELLPNTKDRAEDSKILGKIITGAKLRLVFQVPKELEPLTPETGERSRVCLGNKESSLTFMGTSFNQSSLFWIYEDETFEPDFLKKRVFKSFLIYKTTSGVRVPCSALDYSKEEGWRLLTAVARRKNAMAPVTLIDQNDDWAIIQGIPEGTPLTPKRARF